MKKLMKIANDRYGYMLQDDYENLRIPTELIDHVTESEMWLVDVTDTDVELIVKSLNDTMTLYENGKFVKYGYNAPTVNVDSKINGNETEKEHKNELLQDLSETKDLMSDSYNLTEESYTLSSGKNITIKCGVHGGHFRRYSKELDYTSISPMSLDIIKEMADIYSPVVYDPDLGILSIKDKIHIPINAHDLVTIFDDLHVVATPDGNRQVMGEYKSSQLVSTKSRHIADYPGGYEVEFDLSGSNGFILLPKFEWKDDNHLLKNVTKYDVRAIEYPEFKNCIAGYIGEKAAHSNPDQICALINTDFKNFDGSYINLTVFDKMELRHQVENSYEISLDCCPEPELSAF